MHPIRQTPSKLLQATRHNSVFSRRITTAPPQSTRHPIPLLSTQTHPQQQQQQHRPYSHGGYGDGTGDPRASNPIEQGESNPATEKIEHPGTKPTKPAKPPGQQQSDSGETRGQPVQGKPTMRDDWNDVSNEATNVPPEKQSEEVRRHNEEVVSRHDREVGRDKFGGRERG